MNFISEFKKDSKAYKFLELAQPNKEWFSREVSIHEFVWKYSDLKFWNGADWARTSSKFQKFFNVVLIKSQEIWKPTIALKLDWLKQIKDDISQYIRRDIRQEISKQRCIILWTHRSCDHKTETDHKDGRKNNPQVMKSTTQKIEDFQPLSKPANDAKRQYCKECSETGIRYNAKKLWYTVSYTEWEEKYNEKLWCKWCFWYDPIEFRKHLKFIWNK